MKKLKRYLLGGFGGTMAAAALAFAYTVTSNMSLKVPATGDTDYPTSISDSFTLIDAHDHSSGKGVQIPAGGLETNAVTTVKIADSNVTTAKIADGNVTGAKLASGIVDNSTIEISSNTLRIKDSGVVTAKIAANAVTRAKLEALGQQLSSSSGGHAVDASYGDITNLSVSLTTTGRPVFVAMISDASGSEASLASSAASNMAGSIKFLRGATEIGRYGILVAAFQRNPVPLFVIDTPSAGTYTYKAQAIEDTGTFTINNYKLIAFEF